MRFNRDYELFIEFKGQTLYIKPPIRITFDSKKSIDNSLNKAKVSIYNLQESTRLALVKDVGQKTKISVKVSIGYNGKLDKLFMGDLYHGSFSRNGNDFITTLDIYDGGYDFFNSFTSKTVKSKQQAITSILADMPNTDTGKITNMANLSRPKVLVGNSYKLIADLVDNQENYYIDNGQLFIIKQHEVATSFIPLVCAETGLLNMPEHDNKKVTFTTMLNPTLRIGNNCQLRSKTAPNLDGVYKINSIQYEGDSEGKKWQQTVSCSLASGTEVVK